MRISNNKTLCKGEKARVYRRPITILANLKIHVQKYLPHLIIIQLIRVLTIVGDTIYELKGLSATDENIIDSIALFNLSVQTYSIYVKQIRYHRL